MYTCDEKRQTAVGEKRNGKDQEKRCPRANPVWGHVASSEGLILFEPQSECSSTLRDSPHGELSLPLLTGQLCDTG